MGGTICATGTVPVTTTPTVPAQDGVMQAAITDFIRNDESVMKAIIDTVSNALVTKLIGNKSFIDELSQKLMDNGVLDSVKQSVYEALMPWTLAGRMLRSQPWTRNWVT